MEARTSLRRRMNDDRRRRFAHAELLALLCECGDPDCSQTVVLSPAQFDERRPGVVIHPVHGVLATEGELPDLSV